MAKVVLKNITKKFDGQEVVKNLSLTTKDKEFIVLVGPSGCGKTTTLRMIAGLEDANEGEIYIDDRLVNDIPPKDRDIAMVFQSYALYPHMSVYENLAFGLKLRRVHKKEIKERVSKAVEILNLEGLLDRKPKQLSGGQRQRVALGRAIVRNPKVFLMDEPLSNLDAKLRVQMRGELKRLHERLQTTIIYVTHDQVEAMTLGERIALMHEGMLQQVGEPLAVYSLPANTFVARFIGSPPMNFFEGMLIKKENKIFFESENFCLLLPDDLNNEGMLNPWINKKVLMGVRPEDILVSEGEITPFEIEHRFNHRKLEYQPTVISGEVDFGELMGSETYLHLKIGKSLLVAKVDPHTTAQSGTSLNIIFNLREIHFFDSESKKHFL